MEVFCKIFHVQFFTFKRFGNIEKGQDSRVENLLDMFGIKYRLIGNENIGNLAEVQDIEFEKVDNHICQDIKMSKNYLRNALNNIQ